MINFNFSQASEELVLLIKKAEAELRDNGCFASASFKELTWEPYKDKFRICFKQRPLMQHRWRQRLEQGSSITGMQRAAVKAHQQSITGLSVRKPAFTKEQGSGAFKR